MTDVTWQLLTTAPNMPAAHAVANLLEGNGVACRLKADSALLGEARSCAVLVEASRMHRAKWVLSEATFAEAELDFLATGQPGGEHEQEEP
jgi:hypothetical protein